MGGSNDTSPAQCTTMSMSLGSTGTFGRSPSITSIRLSSSASGPPAASRTPRKMSFLTTVIIRSRAPAERFRRTSTAGVVSGSSVRIFQSSCSPMKPVTPVIRIFLPASRSRSRPSSSGRSARSATTLRRNVSAGVTVLMRGLRASSLLETRVSSSASVRVKLPTYRAVPMMAPSTPTSTSAARSAMSVRDDIPPLATTGASVREHTSRSRSVLGPDSMPSEATSVTT